MLNFIQKQTEWYESQTRRYELFSTNTDSLLPMPLHMCSFPVGINCENGRIITMLETYLGVVSSDKIMTHGQIKVEPLYCTEKFTLFRFRRYDAIFIKRDWKFKIYRWYKKRVFKFKRLFK